VPERSVCSVWAVAVAVVSVAFGVCRARFLFVVVLGVVASVCIAGVASTAFGVDGSCATPLVAAALLFDLAPPRLLARVLIVLLFCVFEFAFWLAGSWALTSRLKVAKTTAKATVIRIFLPMNHLLPIRLARNSAWRLRLSIPMFGGHSQAGGNGILVSLQRPGSQPNVENARRM